MSFTREHLLITHTSDSVKLALDVYQEEYDGDIVVQHAQTERSLSGTLIIKKGVTKRIFTGTIAVDDDVSGTVEYDSVAYTLATPALIKALQGIEDMKVKSFDDTSFWNGWLTSEWAPKVVYDPMGAHRVTLLNIVEK